MRVERLTSEHDLSSFDCGVTALNDWLRTHALESQLRDLSRTFALVDDEGSIVGYYSLTMGGVRKDVLPARYGRGLPGYEIGMVLLARFAIVQSRQGEGLGRDLLIEAIGRSAMAGQHAAARFIAVDPIDDQPRSFYAAFGFKPVGGDDRGRMFLRIDEAIAALGGDDGKERDT